MPSLTIDWMGELYKGVTPLVGLGTIPKGIKVLYRPTMEPRPNRQDGDQ